MTGGGAWKREDHHWKAGYSESLAQLEFRSSEWLGNCQSDTSGLEFRSGVDVDGSLLVLITLRCSECGEVWGPRDDCGIATAIDNRNRKKAYHDIFDKGNARNSALCNEKWCG